MRLNFVIHLVPFSNSSLMMSVRTRCNHIAGFLANTKVGIPMLKYCCIYCLPLCIAFTSVFGVLQVESILKATKGLKNLQQWRAVQRSARVEGYVYGGV